MYLGSKRDSVFFLRATCKFHASYKKATLPTELDLDLEHYKFQIKLPTGDITYITFTSTPISYLSMRLPWTVNLIGQKKPQYIEVSPKIPETSLNKIFIAKDYKMTEHLEQNEAFMQAVCELTSTHSFVYEIAPNIYKEYIYINYDFEYKKKLQEQIMQKPINSQNHLY